MEWWKLSFDIGLLVALAVFGVRLVRSSAPRVNLGRLSELDGTLRALLREADAASRSLNELLLKRQKDIEKVVFDAETVEGRLNRQITAADERRGMLEVSLGKATSVLRAQHEDGPAPRHSTARIETRDEAQALSSRRVRPPVVELEVQASEPPSFERSRATGPAAIVPARRKLRLDEQVEREVLAKPTPLADDKKPVAPQVSPEAQRLLERLGVSADEIRERARELQKHALLSEEPQKKREPEPTEQKSAVVPEGTSVRSEDPRLGVLADFKRASIRV